MFRYLYRQRRRLLFAAFFAILMTVMFLVQNRDAFAERMDGRAALIIALAALAVGLATLLIGALFITVFPRWRYLLELMAISLFLQAVLAQIAPDQFGFGASGIVPALLPLATTMLTWTLMYGQLLDRFPMWVRWSTRRHYASPRSKEDMWHSLVPGKAPPDAHWDPLLQDLKPTPEEPDSVDVLYAHGHSLFEHQTITYLVDQPFTHCRYYFQGEVNPANRDLTDGIHDIQIAPQATGCRVTITHTRNALLPRIGLQMWFDDIIGDQCDYLRSRDRGARDWSVTGKYRRNVLRLS